jgi:hypothetical protein
VSAASGAALTLRWTVLTGRWTVLKKRWTVLTESGTERTGSGTERNETASGAGRPERTQETFGGSASALGFHPEGRRIMAASDVRTLREVKAT